MRCPVPSGEREARGTGGADRNKELSTRSRRENNCSAGKSCFKHFVSLSLRLWSFSYLCSAYFKPQYTACKSLVKGTFLENHSSGTGAPQSERLDVCKVLRVPCCLSLVIFLAEHKQLVGYVCLCICICVALQKLKVQKFSHFYHIIATNVCVFDSNFLRHMNTKHCINLKWKESENLQSVVCICQYFVGLCCSYRCIFSFTLKVTEIIGRT